MTATRFVSRTLQEFSDDLASPLPTPGGGSAAAYAGALGAALAAMVARIASKKDPAANAAFISELDALRAELLALVDDDAAAFGHFADAMKLPRGTDDEKRRRSERMQAALVIASEVPLQICDASRRLLDACEKAVEMANTATVSDVGAGALLGEACLRAASLNVLINITSLKDERQSRAISDRLSKTLAGAEEQKQRIVRLVETRIRG